MESIGAYWDRKQMGVKEKLSFIEYQAINIEGIIEFENQHSQHSKPTFETNIRKQIITVMMD